MPARKAATIRIAPSIPPPIVFMETSLPPAQEGQQAEMLRKEFRLARRMGVGRMPFPFRIFGTTGGHPPGERNLYGRRKELEKMGRAGKTGGQGRHEHSGIRAAARGGGPQPEDGADHLLSLWGVRSNRERLAMVHVLEVWRHGDDDDVLIPKSQGVCGRRRQETGSHRNVLQSQISRRRKSRRRGRFAPARRPAERGGGD